MAQTAFGRKHSFFADLYADSKWTAAMFSSLD
jgi:hypothetical protein